MPTLADWEKYYLSDAPDREETLLRSLEDMRNQKARAFFEIAIKYLGEGDRDKAREYLRQTAEHGEPEGFAMPWSTSILERMQLQPDWPKSIPAKK